MGQDQGEAPRRKGKCLACLEIAILLGKVLHYFVGSSGAWQCQALQELEVVGLLIRALDISRFVFQFEISSHREQD